MMLFELISKYAFMLCNGIALVLCVLTYALFEHVPHYTDTSGELMVNPGFNEGLSGWRSSKAVYRDQVGTIDLTNSNPEELKSIYQIIPTPKSRALRVSSVYSTRNVTQGAKNWHNARLGVAGKDESGEWRWDFRGTVFAQTGTVNLKRASKVVVVPEGVDELKVEFELGGATGEFRIHQIEAIAVERIPLVSALTSTIRGAWVILGALIGLIFAYNRLWLPLFTGIAASFLLIFIPKSQKDELLSWSSNWLPSLGAIDIDHLLLFLLLTTTLLLYAAIGRAKCSRHWLFVSLVFAAISLEIVQYFTLYRTVNLKDALVNVTGVCLPFLLLYLSSRSSWRKGGVG